jgi:primosomal protein N' (replication factor Y)
MDPSDQLTLAVPPAAGPPATPSPFAGVARVVLDVPLPHLDRPFDYAVPVEMAEAAVPGARVSVRFAGRETTGFIVARQERSEHEGTLTPLRRVVSAVPVLTPEVLAAARAVADHYAGTLGDVLRLAVPPRHARVERAVGDASAQDRGADPETGSPAGAEASWSQEAWAPYEGGAAFVRRLSSGESPRAVWSALPDGGARPRRAAIAAAVAAVLASGRGALVVVPDVHEVDRLSTALTDSGIEHARLVAEDGPAARYRSFLHVLHGHVRVAVGTRAAAFAPVDGLGLVAVWDDGDDLLAEPRAPYPHTLAVLRMRADLAGAAALIGGHARSTAAQQLVAEGWARAVQASRPTVRAGTPRVLAPNEADLAREGPAAHARIPHPAWELVRSALDAGPVLVQVPRAGYVPVTCCATCRAPARCPHCHGPLRLDRVDAPPACAWCGRVATAWVCPECRATGLRARRLGSARTAEELGRAFPGVPVVLSSAAAPAGVVRAIDAEPRLVVATPGAEPEAEGRYAAALLLDAAVTTGRPELWAAEEAVRRWFNAAALVRTAPEGGRVMLLGQGAPVPTQALVRWDPSGFAERELAERAALRLPPSVAIASAQGGPEAVRSFLSHLPPGLDAEVLGPVPVSQAPVAAHDVGHGERGEGEAPVRAILRLDPARGGELSRALVVAAAARSARKEPGSVRVQVDPTELW